MKRGRSLFWIGLLLVAMAAGPTVILRRAGAPSDDGIRELLGPERLLDAPAPLPSGTTPYYRY